MRNQLIALGTIGAILLLAVVYFISQNTTPATPTPAPQQVTTETQAVEDASPSAQVSEVKEFTINASNYKFDLAEIKVKVGDKVKITFKNSGGIHDLKIDEFGVATRRLDSGESEVVEFTASKAGTFEYYCSIANHRVMGMKGTLVVE